MFAEDPRLFALGQVAYILLITRQGMRITPFDHFHPVLLTFSGGPLIPEKNWAPLVIDNKIHFIYCFDPLVVLYWDMNRDGLLKVAYKDAAVDSVPFSTTGSVLRGDLG
jgi:hypothetical protein